VLGPERREPCFRDDSHIRSPAVRHPAIPSLALPEW
jgi:hypothetical protein